MERLTIPDEHIEGGIRRAVIDARMVKEKAMIIYWALKKYEDTGLTPEDIMDGKMLTGWIPVEERLPEAYGSYMVAWKPVGLEIEYDHYYEIIEFDPEDESGWIGAIEQSPGDYEILSWMPLTEPYKEAEG